MDPTLPAFLTIDDVASLLRVSQENKALLNGWRPWRSSPHCPDTEATKRRVSITPAPMRLPAKAGCRLPTPQRFRTCGGSSSWIGWKSCGRQRPPKRQDRRASRPPWFNSSRSRLRRAICSGRGIRCRSDPAGRREQLGRSRPVPGFSKDRPSRHRDHGLSRKPRIGNNSNPTQVQHLTC
jgi:hypothetical protein